MQAVLEALCSACHIPPWLFKIMFWLGYCNSMMNPIIYSCASRDFKRAFLRILRCRQCCDGVRPGSSAAESVDQTPRHRQYDPLSVTVGSGSPQSVAIATTDASVSGGGSAGEEHLSMTSSTPGGRRRRLARFGVKSSSPRQPSSSSSSAAAVTRPSACRQQCCDDSPLVALRVFHDRQRLARSAVTSPHLVTSPADNEARDATGGAVGGDLRCQSEA